MEQLYLIAHISRQGHFEALKQERRIAEKAPLYLGLMQEIRKDHPGMGLRRMHEQFCPEGIGRDAWISLGLRGGFRLGEVLNHQKTTIAVKHHRYCNLLEEREFTDVNQIWVSDLFYFPLNGRHYYGVLIMDVYSRKIIGYSMAENMRSEHNVSALSMALLSRGVSNYEQKLIHHSDRGSQYVSDDYTNLLQGHGIQISMCTDVLENAHCERVNGTIKNQYLNRWDIATAEQLYQRMAQAVKNYNNRRHHSLGMTPDAYEQRLWDIPLEKRSKMTIFTINHQQNNPSQLTLNI